jgi:glycine betaine/proline transport system substrate-binding protein
MAVTQRLVLALLMLACLVLPSMAQEADPTAPPAETAAPDAPCGTQPITIARMGWSSAELLAEIHSRVLTSAYGCTVRIVPGDLAATGSSMATTGQPAVAPEMWIGRIADIWNSALKSQTMRAAGQSFGDGALEGWFVPDYVATANPAIVSAASLKDHWQVFAAGGSKGKFISCPPDWGCALINRNMLRANGLENLFDIVEPANRYEMDKLIAEAESRKEPIVFYYWQPNAVLAQFSFKALDLGVYDKEAFACLGKIACLAPRPSAFASELVVSALAEWVFTDTPSVAAYFQRAAMPLAEMNKLLLALNEAGATPASVADAFIAEHREIWHSWVGTQGK